MNEKTIHRQVCDFIRYQYPDVIFNTDLSGATKLTMNQAVAMKRLRSGRGFPDIAIYEPRGKFHGLFLELKKEGTSLMKKKIVDDCGDIAWASDHLKEQNEMMERLRSRGYAAEFAIGFEQARKIIDQYLKS